MNDPVSRLNAALEGRYRLEGKLGEGGMATVHLAEDVRHGRKVALKVLKPELAAAVGAERFLSEIRTTANLQHPHILPLFDSGEADGFLYYVMPYVEGESLRERLDRERELPVEDAVGVAARLADALDYAHRQGVVHRDIKPANVLMHDGEPILTDFGIALAVGAAGGGRLTETGLSVGTPLYMSPEQATGQERVGPAADVYALGCVLYEMLAGRPPYTGTTPQAILARIVTGTAEPVRELRSAVPANVDAAVGKALEKLPADRFRSAADFAAALSDPGFRWGDSARATGRDARFWRSVAAALGAVALVLALALGWSSFDSRDGPERPPVRHTSVLVGEGDAASGVAGPVAISMDGSRIVYRVSTAGGGRELWSRRLSARESVPIPGTQGAEQFFLSPDGGWVGFYEPDEGEIRRVSLSGGPVERVAATGGDGFFGGAWGPDGTIVFAVRGGLRRVSATGGTPRELTSVDPEGDVRHRQPSFLPDGSGLVFTVTELVGFPVAHRIVRMGLEGDTTSWVPGHSPWVTADGVLLFGRGRWIEGSLWAARVREDGSGLAGEPVRVLEGHRSSSAEVDATAHFGLAEDGTLVYVPTDANPGSGRELVWVDRSGGATPVLGLSDPQLPPGAENFHAARLSPDGTRVAFTALYGFGAATGFRLFVYDLRRGVLNAVTVGANADWPVWTPDGEELVFNRFSEGEQNLYRARADNSGVAEPLMPPNPHQQFAQQFSPDGRFLVIQHHERVRASDSDFRLLAVGGDGEPVPLVAGPGYEKHAALDPGGRWLAFVTDESGRDQVYVTDFPDAQRRIRVSTESAFAPVWNPAGGELFFRRARDGAVMAVTVETGPEFSAGRPEVLIEGGYYTCCRYGRSWDVGPGGARFLMLRGGEERSGIPRVEVVQHWLQEVRRQLGG